MIYFSGDCYPPDLGHFSYRHEAEAGHREDLLRHGDIYYIKCNDGYYPTPMPKLDDGIDEIVPLAEKEFSFSCINGKTPKQLSSCKRKGLKKTAMSCTNVTLNQK